METIFRYCYLREQIPVIQLAESALHLISGAGGPTFCLLLTDVSLTM